MFKIIVVGGFAEKYIDHCLVSILEQVDVEWDAQVVLDPIDNSYNIAKQYESDNLKVFVNKKRLYAISNIIKAIELLKPKDEDVLVFIDADDWFCYNDSLYIVSLRYDACSKLLVTYGSWVGYPTNNMPNNSIPYKEKDFIKGIRNVYWKASALRTMKYKIWKKIKDSDLRDADGNYFKSAWDVAIMFPVIEMAGFDRIKHINRPLYVYNKETEFSDDKINLKEQRKNKEYICNMQPYSYCEGL